MLCKLELQKLGSHSYQQSAPQCLHIFTVALSEDKGSWQYQHNQQCMLQLTELLPQPQPRQGFLFALTQYWQSKQQDILSRFITYHPSDRPQLKIITANHKHYLRAEGMGPHQINGLQFDGFGLLHPCAAALSYSQQIESIILLSEKKVLVSIPAAVAKSISSAQ